MPYIIAELGTAHGGSLSKAKELIDAAKEACASCVKFQIVFADEILHPNTGIVPLPGGNTRLYDVFKSLEADFDFFAELQKYAAQKKIDFLATPFGLKSAALLKKLKPSLVKTASPELNYTQLIEEIARWNIPVFVSTGVSTLADIENAVFIFDKFEGGRKNITLLHCITSYPAPPSEYNLRLLTTLSAVFGVKTGLSDHSLDSSFIPSIAAALGAAAIEKHFCLSRKDPGLDDPIALPPALFLEMTASVREVSKLKDEWGSEAALSFLKEKYGAETVEAALGDGVKRLSRSETANYGRTNRSIHALYCIEKGEAFTKDNSAVLRTEKILRLGLPPSMWEKIIGRKAQNSIPAGEGIRLEDI